MYRHNLQAAGTAKPSFVKAVIELCQASGDLSPEMVSMMKGAAGTLYVGKLKLISSFTFY